MKPKEIPSFLFSLSEIARNNNQSIYLVGGAVRDFLLNKRNFDIDIICDMGAIELAKKLEEEGFAEIKSLHKDFGTAKVIIKENKQEIDIATTRSETYSEPGALPKTHYPTSIQKDLSRRDFTINAIALKIENKEIEFIDPFDGRADLRAGIIQVLHSKSYYEDPTRIFRAIRFAT
ncbi:MAG TPA: poly-A polymerase, partial [Vampirovibrionales bacterium]